MSAQFTRKRIRVSQEVELVAEGLLDQVNEKLAAEKLGKVNLSDLIEMMFNEVNLEQVSEKLYASKRAQQEEKVYDTKDTGRPSKYASPETAELLTEFLEIHEGVATYQQAMSGTRLSRYGLNMLIEHFPHKFMITKRGRSNVIVLIANKQPVTKRGISEEEKRILKEQQKEIRSNRRLLRLRPHKIGEQEFVRSARKKWKTPRKEARRLYPEAVRVAQYESFIEKRLLPIAEIPHGETLTHNTIREIRGEYPPYLSFAAAIEILENETGKPYDPKQVNVHFIEWAEQFSKSELREYLRSVYQFGEWNYLFEDLELIIQAEKSRIYFYPQPQTELNH